MAEELRGWKDIGAHFGTSDRTAQRWEREHGMPVHRTGRTRGASVFAFAEELDAWRLSPEGVRAGSESGAAARTGNGVTTAVPRHARSRASVITLAAAAVLVLAVAVAWLMYSRRPSPVAPLSRSASDGYSVPKSPQVFLLKITTADGTPFVLHVLDGGMATLAAHGGVKLGFVPARSGTAAKLVAVRLDAVPNGGERLAEIRRLGLTAHTPIHFDYPGMSVGIEWTDTLRSSELPEPPPHTPRQCCIVCGSVTACAAQVSAPPCAGSCCGFGGCRDAK